MWSKWRRVEKWIWFQDITDVLYIYWNIYIYISLTAMAVAVIEKQGLGTRKEENVK